METKKLKFQTVAAGNQGTVDATIVEGENKENNAAKTAGMAAAGIAAGAAAGYAGYEAYQQFAGTVEAEPMTADSPSSPAELIVSCFAFAGRLIFS